MPPTRDGASVGARTVTLWVFLTIAAMGFALTAAGLTTAPDGLVLWGVAIMSFAALAFLFIQFWQTQTGPAPQAAAASGPRPVRGRPKKAAARALNDQAQAAVNKTSGAEDGLVEFTIDTPPEPEAKPPDRPRPEGSWPETTEAQWRRQRRQTLPPGEFELPPAFQKRKEFTADMPIVRSIFEDEPEDDEDDGPVERDGKTRGQCGECGTYLWAPKRRPIRLRCPKCGKVARLTA